MVEFDMEGIALSTYGFFFVTTALLALSPGPDNLFVLIQSARFGGRAGLSITAGLCTGLLGHTLAVLLGVAALLQTSAVAFTVLKILGALYLIYLAYKAWNAPVGGHSMEECDTGESASKPSNTRYYRTGILMNLTNPKVTLFFLAFLPQFVNPSAGQPEVQIMIFAALTIISSFIVFSVIALVASALSKLLFTKPIYERGLNRFAATVFAGLAVKLMMSRVHD
jgi:threonine/homoserine/homoserine lactone efflux protein